MAGDQSEGVDVHSQANDGSTATPRLDLTGEVDFGELRIVNSDDADIDQGSHFHSGDGLDRDQMSADLRAACAPPTSPPADAGEAGGGAGGSHRGSEPWRAERGEGRVKRRLDRVSLAAGLGVIAMGVLLLADQEDALSLSLGIFGAIVSALIGTILLISGIDEDRER